MRIETYSLVTNPSDFDYLHIAIDKLLFGEGLHSPVLTLCITFAEKFLVRIEEGNNRPEGGIFHRGSPCVTETLDSL